MGKISADDEESEVLDMFCVCQLQAKGVGDVSGRHSVKKAQHLVYPNPGLDEEIPLARLPRANGGAEGLLPLKLEKPGDVIAKIEDGSVYVGQYPTTVSYFNLGGNADNPALRE